jgi:Holliday junction resolvase RusA-like endonuclease
METLKARSEVFQALNENNFNSRILYPIKLPFEIDGAIKIFHNKQKLKHYMTTKPPLQNILQGILHTEEEKDLTAHNQTLKQQQQKQPDGRNHHIPPY